MPGDAFGISFGGDIYSHFRTTFNFYVVRDTDPKIHTIAPGKGLISRETHVFLNATEVAKLIQATVTMGLEWSPEQYAQAKAELTNQLGDVVEFTVAAHSQSASAYLRAPQMCGPLGKLDPLMPTKALLFWFRMWRLDNGCLVVGFDPSDYPKD